MGCQAGDSRGSHRPAPAPRGENHGAPLASRAGPGPSPLARVEEAKEEAGATLHRSNPVATLAASSLKLTHSPLPSPPLGFIALSTYWPSIRDPLGLGLTSFTSVPISLVFDLSRLTRYSAARVSFSRHD
jgi:hypothetical protein